MSQTVLRTRPLASLIITSPGFVPWQELQTLLTSMVDTAITTSLLRSVTPEGIAEAWEQLDYTLEQVATAAPDIVVQNTVAFALTGDPTDMDNLAARIIDATGGKAVVGLKSAVNAMQSLDIRHPLMVAPYSMVLRDRFDVVMRANGIDPVGWTGPQMTTPAAINAFSSADTAGYVLLALTEQVRKPDAIFISGGGWPSLGLIGELEKKSGLPVLTSNTAQTWMVGKLTGRPCNFADGGRLLAGQQ